MTFKPFSPHKYLFIMTLTVSIKQSEKSELILAKYTYEAKAPFCVPLPILSRSQAERTQGLYPDTTVNQSKGRHPVIKTKKGGGGEERTLWRSQI